MGRVLSIGIVVLLVAAVGLFFWLKDDGGEMAQQDQAPPAAATSPDAASSEAASSQATDAAKPDGERTAHTAQPAGSQDPTAEASPGQPEADSDTSVPSFDVVRVDPDGNAVIAGRAKPGSRVTVTRNNKPLGETTADARGQFVFVPDRPLEPGNQELGLEMREGDGGESVLSKDVVMVAVPRTKPTDLGQGQKPEEALALLSPRQGDGPSRVLQVPGQNADPNQLAVDVVDYDAKGNLSLSGHASKTAGGQAAQSAPPESVRVYLDNRLVGQGDVDGQGNWHIVPDTDVEPGEYKLRVDQVRGEEVVARIELPFSRAAPLTDFAGEPFVIVQPGANLWRIARNTMGSGPQYTLIYRENADQIRDPDLIYPGQVFSIPRRNTN